MIILDLNQVMIQNLMKQIGGNNSVPLDENLIRHMVLNSIRSYNVKFKKEYGSLVIACDSKNKYWRKEFFPFYKSNRKKDREASGFDWALIFSTLDTLKNELKDKFPYKVIEVDGAEADDIIAVLTRTFYQSEPILILSADKDFMQLQKYSNVKQYSPITKKFLKTDDVELFKKSHIIHGDRGDGIPNVLSADNTFVMGKRQRTLTEKRVEVLLTEGIEYLSPDAQYGFVRNQHLIDFDFIPEKIVKNIIDTYTSIEVAPRRLLFDYFVEKRLKNLFDCISEF